MEKQSRRKLFTEYLKIKGSSATESELAEKFGIEKKTG